MLDLTQLINSELKIKWGDDTLRCPTLSNFQYLEMIEIESNFENLAELNKKKSDYVFHYLNTNKDKREITVDEFNQLPLKAIMEIYSYMAKDIYGAINDPN